ncbi:hypothetical protein Nepgr_033212 [Nepenthes gracilis]|uniref:Uncharacterized protein n=1 Tax=Nepenthes gracilis TaxID=150966 RepID=A0AAD3TLM6_NEPGR|nr:hypothetical protein Nepgr_033212 [Nepenthes gracilis]
MRRQLLTQKRGKKNRGGGSGLNRGGASRRGSGISGIFCCSGFDRVDSSGLEGGMPKAKAGTWAVEGSGHRGGYSCFGSGGSFDVGGSSAL